MVTDPTSGMIHFDIGIARKRLAASAFDMPPECRPEVEEATVRIARSIPKYNNVSWRGNSGLRDDLSDQSYGKSLVSEFYDVGNAIKFSFSLSFSMTMLSCNVIEYSAKYKSTEELHHIKEIIRCFDLAAEVAAALTTTSIVFKDDNANSHKLVHGAFTLWKFASRDIKHKNI
ncbi:hypothetical protein ZIOFF_073167 [Zingiber officinale]|uniref:cellulase n=1 Tax=Zingiber officinale TaxID=94328 RepID=A0A8J5ESK0_ZINOF|nr:hypothetical protein ZIOFF_073167 [Zingiber officinale]